MKVEPRSVTPGELESARGIFSTGHYGKARPCVRYGGLGEPRALPAGPVARQARALFLAFTETA